MRKKNKTDPLVSIIMNCHNGEKYLNQSLKSVVNQNYQKWELIFYNNLSTDKSKRVVQKYQKDKRIKYFESKTFLNLYDARNEAIIKSKGDYICFLDTDDLWNKNKLKIQIDYIKKNNCKILFSKYFIFNQIKNKKYLNKKQTLFSGDDRTQSLLDEYTVGILTVIIKRSIFDKIKFNKNYNIIGDFDFFLRVSLSNKIHAINKPLATYRHHGQNISHTKLDLYIKEFIYWLKKNEFKLKKYNLINIRINILKLKIKKIFKKKIN
jgi:glycosyltransferase involved in cell wall biosynthesis